MGTEEKGVLFEGSNKPFYFYAALIFLLFLLGPVFNKAIPHKNKEIPRECSCENGYQPILFYNAKGSHIKVTNQSEFIKWNDFISPIDAMKSSNQIKRIRSVDLIEEGVYFKSVFNLLDDGNEAYYLFSKAPIRPYNQYLCACGEQHYTRENKETSFVIQSLNKASP